MAVEDLLVDLGIATVAVIIGAYVLNFLGYLTHNSPVNMFAGTAPTKQLMQEAGTGGISQGLIRSTNSGNSYSSGQTALQPGSVGSQQSSWRTAVI